MDTFLGNVAQSLWKRHGEGISSLKLLVPNLRSRLFFARELSRVADRPLWEPEYVTIDDLMYSIAERDPADRIKSVVELYKVYSEYHKEDFDSFYYWGEMLLADFDQIDKYLVDADRLFSNLSDLKALENGLGYLEADQKEVVRRFWTSFGRESEHSDEKHDFLNIWNTLSDIYHGFHGRLEITGNAYTGMAHRIAVEKIRSGEVPDTGGSYAVIGFNALTKCEKVLFDYLQSSGCAEFFWDYDEYYLKDVEQEAGLFMRDNIARYPHPGYFTNSYDNFSKPKNITAVSVASDSLQCKYAAEFVRSAASRQEGKIGKETAIVLTNENLLVPLLYSIPGEAAEINVTMGYPLRQTLAYSFVERLLKLQEHVRVKEGVAEFYHADATGLLTHPFVLAFDKPIADKVNADIISKSRIYAPENIFGEGELVPKIFSARSDWKGIIPYVTEIISLVASSANIAGRDKEYFGTIADTLRKLGNSLEGCGLEMTIRVLSSLARRMLQNLSIPFSGEPLRGLQIMGILETRNLDFRNVMIMSMNDDTFPGNLSAGSSFIPYNLRLGYGLPTPRHHEGVYAYYFYRLLQRAENIDLVYCSRNDENSSGEQSRYIYQLEYESPHSIVKRQIDVDVNISRPEEITIHKSDVILRMLDKYIDGGPRSLSPSAFNAWLDCRLKFYFRTVAGMRTEDAVAEEIDLPMFGTILHKAVEILYRPLSGCGDPRRRLGELIRSPEVDKAVDDAIAEEYFHGENMPAGGYEGNIMMVRDIVLRYINGALLPFDSQGERFAILSLEEKMSGDVEFSVNNKPHTVRFYGVADRIDMIEGNGLIRIVDYKTGRPKKEFKSIEALFSPAKEDRAPAVLQTFLYSFMADRMQRKGLLEGTDSCPVLYYVREMNDPGYSPQPVMKQGRGECVAVMRYSDYRREFEEMLRSQLSQVFDPAVPFTQCEDAELCRNCDFRTICRR